MGLDLRQASERHREAKRSGHLEAPPGHCPACSHKLVITDTRCPACGAMLGLRAKAPRTKGDLGWLWMLLAAGLLIGMLFG